MDSISCLYCSRSFSAKKNLYRHMRNFHPSETIGICHAKNICCICNQELTSISNLHNHIQHSHKNVKLLFQELVFYSESDFKEWKSKMETDSCARFVKKRGSVEATDGKSLNYFYCHRSGNYEKKMLNQLRFKRFSKTKKIGKTCPACITTSKIEHDGLCEIKVKFQSVHMGHEMLVEKIPFSVNDKSVLTTQMTHAVSASNILRNRELSFRFARNENTYCSSYMTVESFLQNKCLKTNFEQDRAETISGLQNLLFKCQSTNTTINELKTIARGVEDIKVKLNMSAQSYIPGIIQLNTVKNEKISKD